MVFIKKKIKKQVILDYSGQIITIGLDVHLRQWNVSIYVGKRHYKTFQQNPCPETLYKYLIKEFPGGTYQSSYEAGYFGYYTHRRLVKLGIANMVVNAADIPTSDKEKRRKNDRVDAKKIGRAHLNGSTEGIYIPSEQMEADRKLLRYRVTALRKETTRNKQRLKAYLVNLGAHDKIENYDNSYWSKDLIKQIRELKLEQPRNRFVLDQLLDKYEFLRTTRKKVDRQIVLLSKEPRYEKIVEYLRSIPGIGLLTAMVFITEIWDMKRFENLDKLCSFVGIVPDTSSSDTKEKVSGLTKRANAELRRLLLQSSWVASGRCRYLASVYQKNKKLRQQKAIIKVARKLLSIIRAVWLKEEKYNIEKMYQV